MPPSSLDPANHPICCFSECEKYEYLLSLWYIHNAVLFQIPVSIFHRFLLLLWFLSAFLSSHIYSIINSLSYFFSSELHDPLVLVVMSLFVWLVWQMSTLPDLSEQLLLFPVPSIKISLCSDRSSLKCYSRKIRCDCNLSIFLTHRLTKQIKLTHLWKICP